MSVSFDRAADFYDETRGFPPGVSEQVCGALLEAGGATPQSRILELGIGTGRIALPFIRAGYSYTGIDLSPRMLERMRSKLRDIPDSEKRVTLIEGDIESLPFADHSFDIVITVNVFHLVSNIRRAIEESVRVLARPGVALNGYEDGRDDSENALEMKWDEILERLGTSEHTRRSRNLAPGIVDEWRRLGGETDTLVAVEGETTWVASRYIESLERRVWSSTWSIPDDIYAPAIQELRAWAIEYYGERFNAPLPVRRNFVIERARFS